MAMNYLSLSEDVQKKILADRQNHQENASKCLDASVLRRLPAKDKANLWRPAYARDTEKIMHCPYYNRYTDKTQVFSFYRNDDITRRSLHVQLVSRIARTIGELLGLNIDLIEAISLGHDIGHTPFGHVGEKYVSELLFENTGRIFNHNVHSVRVLDTLFARNVSLQTLDGILCHNGEIEKKIYEMAAPKTFEKFDEEVAGCYVCKKNNNKLIPFTLEGCVVRICDMIAYLGKDRQDAVKAKVSKERSFAQGRMGATNAEIINNMTVDIVENSYGKDHLEMSEDIFTDLKTAKSENYQHIYGSDELNQKYSKDLEPMFQEVYRKLLADAKRMDTNSVLFKHHIYLIENERKYYVGTKYREEEPNQIVVDYIASMTDDYFIDLYKYLFPSGKHEVKYVSYFEDLQG